MTSAGRIAVLVLLGAALAGCGRQGAPQLTQEQIANRGPQAPVKIVPPNTPPNSETAPDRPFILDRLLK
ncbi:hypothetical protein ACRC7T_03125 [Segnochrobactraceae bacterium EtOH-i3]